MYVMNKKWDSITNIAQCTSVYVSPEHEIKAVPTGGGNVYRLGQYETAEIARAVLNDLYMHIPTGCIYQMPNDQRARVLVRGMSDERPEKFAGNGKKPVRRGGFASSGLMNGIKRRRSSLGVWWWLCTRKRALEPHAWSGPVMRCTSFSSGIGQKS